MKMNFVVKIDKDRIYKFDLEEELKIERDDLDSQLGEQPSKFAWFASMCAMAHAKAEKAEYRLKQYEAEIDLKIRESKGDAKLTEAAIKAKVMNDSERLALVNRLIAAKEQYEIVQAARDAFDQRKDCLISIGANRRAEHDVECFLKEKKKNRD